MDKLHIITVAFAVLAIILSTVAMIKQNSKKERYADPAEKKNMPVKAIAIGIVIVVIVILAYLASSGHGHSAISFPAFSF